MSFYKERIYSLLIDQLGDPPPINKVRRQIVPLAEGDVLEIGAGSGANFLYYNSEKVSKLYALEPNPGMIRLAKRRLNRTNLKVEFIDLPGERIPLQDNTIDTVVSTFTLCTIPGVEEAIHGLKRVVRPGGRLIFFELGLAPDLLVQRWQRLFEPLVKKLFQGLYLTRDIPVLITPGNFQITKIEMGYMTRFPKFLSYCWWGSAIKQPNP